VSDVEYTAFVRAQSPALLRSAYLLTRDAAAAEDLIQDTFLRLHGKWPLVSAAAAPAAYVRRAMVNNYLNSTRRKSSHERVIAEMPDRAGDGDLADAVADRMLVAALLDALPPRQRAVLVLRFIHDLDDQQIAAEIGCRKSTVRSIVARGLAGLRDTLDAQPMPQGLGSEESA
jgi:RNA polymerase sigma-70 factor (sigma-E family)